jgi:hypothetical protein
VRCVHTHVPRGRELELVRRNCERARRDHAIVSRESHEQRRTCAARVRELVGKDCESARGDRADVLCSPR